MQTTQCPKCSQSILRQPSEMLNHFKKEHQEFHFRLISVKGNTQIFCEDCKKTISTYKRLCNYHEHTKSSNSTSDAISAPAQARDIMALRNFSRQLNAVFAEMDRLKNEAAHFEDMYLKKTTQVLEMQELVARFK